MPLKSKLKNPYLQFQVSDETLTQFKKSLSHAMNIKEILIKFIDILPPYNLGPELFETFVTKFGEVLEGNTLKEKYVLIPSEGNKLGKAVLRFYINLQFNTVSNSIEKKLKVVNRLSTICDYYADMVSKQCFEDSQKEKFLDIFRFNKIECLEDVYLNAMKIPDFIDHLF